MDITRRVSQLVFFISITGTSLITSLNAQPTWTQILSDTSKTDERSGTYYAINTQAASPVTGVDVSSFSTSPYLQIPSEIPSGSGYAYADDGVCTSGPSWWTASIPMDGQSRPPSSRIVSNYGPATGSYKGIGLNGAFGGPGSGVLSGGGTMNEAVYFHEQPCYFGGREYGFSYDPVNDFLIGYWSTNSNCGTGAQNCSAPSGFNSGDEISGPTYGSFTEPGTGFSTAGMTCTTGSPCFFEMYPVASGSSCYFHISIVGPGPSYTSYFSADTPNVDAGSQSPSVTSADPNFCSAIEAESGYITATTQYSPSLSSVPSSVQLYLDYQSTFTWGIFVGK